ncbi:MAG: hypothetical protein WC889_09065, partial [Myxococcota bacterium]
MPKSVEELESRVKELEREIERLRAYQIAPVTGTIARGMGGPSRMTVMGAEEMLLQVGPDDTIGYMNPPMARLLGVPDRKLALGLPFSSFDHGLIGEGVISALVQMGRRSEEMHILERPCPGLPVENLPPSKGARPAGDPVLRFCASG